MELAGIGIMSLRPCIPAQCITLLAHVYRDLHTPCSFNVLPTLMYYKGKDKAVPLQTWSSPGRSRKLRLSDFMTTAQDGDKVVSLTHRPPLSPGNTPGTHFC